ncbi:MAG: hypothetical protein J5I81_01625 [Nitrococcus mobilis]|nr:hypothetical protein [Nitrococcus mobilis]
MSVRSRKDHLRIVLFSCAGAPLSAETLTSLGVSAPELLDRIVGVVLSQPRPRPTQASRERAAGQWRKELILALGYRWNRWRYAWRRRIRHLGRRLGLVDARRWARIEEFCDARGLIPHYTRDPNAAPTIDFVRRLAPDLILMITFHHILRTPIIEIPRIGCFNVHCSLLPDFRGPDPINEALKNRVGATGVTVHWVDTGIDTGDVAAQASMAIVPGDTEASLRPRLAETAGRLLADLLRAEKEQQLPRISQAETQFRK